MCQVLNQSFFIQVTAADGTCWLCPLLTKQWMDECGSVAICFSEPFHKDYCCCLHTVHSLFVGARTVLLPWIESWVMFLLTSWCIYIPHSYGFHQIWISQERFPGSFIAQYLQLQIVGDFRTLGTLCSKFYIWCYKDVIWINFYSWSCLVLPNVHRSHFSFKIFSARIGMFGVTVTVLEISAN